MGNDGQFVRLCDVLGIPEIAEDERYATGSERIQRQPELSEIIGKIIAKKDCAHWLSELADAHVPCGPINTVKDVFDDPQINHRGMKLTLPHTNAGEIGMAGSPINLSLTPVEYKGGPPVLGEHTEDILRDVLELDDDQIEALRNNKIV